MLDKKFAESTAESLALIHKESFPDLVKAFSSQFISSLIKNDKVVLVTQEKKGFCLLRLSGKESEIITMAVRPQFQGKGIGYSIILEAIELLKETGCEKMFLEVASNNIRAIRLYSKLGFNKCGLRKQYYKNSNGKNIDAIIMEKNLMGLAL